MKIVQINTFPYKATGTIMMEIHKILLQNNDESYVVWGRGRNSKNEHEITIKDNLGVKFHGIYTRITDKTGFASWNATKKLLQELNKIHPDIIHLHNIHGYYINIEMLFNYIKQNHMKVVWTLHDCWAITGHCACFQMLKCDKWINGCYECKQLNEYPASRLLDNSKWNWEKKKALFSGLDMILVTPSKWLKSVIEQSFLNVYPIKVIYNGINLETFKPNFKENIRKKYSPKGKPIILGVASEWLERKGYLDFIKLSKKNLNFQFVMVGLTKKQIQNLPAGIIGILRTNNLQELVELYSVADVFWNPTYEDNLPTTNIEALACGTPVLTYNTGGSPEIIDIASTSVRQKVGIVVQKETSQKVDLSLVEKEMKRLLFIQKSMSDNENKQVNNNTLRSFCRKSAETFNKERRLMEYLELYKEFFYNMPFENNE